MPVVDLACYNKYGKLWGDTARNLGNISSRNFPRDSREALLTAKKSTVLLYASAFLNRFHLL